MIEIIEHIEQGSEEWHRYRIGSIGGSRISRVAAKGEGKMRKQLLYDTVGEIISGEIKDSYTNKYMQDGTENEDEARQYYSLITGNEVHQVALIRDQPHKHVSPDGLIGDGGMVEIKNVIPSVFVEYRLTGAIPIAYRRQMQWGLKRSGRAWCDYVVYCKAFVGKADPMVVVRIERMEKEIAELEAEADAFIEEMLQIVKRLK